MARCNVCGMDLGPDLCGCTIFTPDRISWLRSQRAKPARRTCLACGREFDSAHCGNRICDRCKGAEIRRFYRDGQV